MFQASEFIEQRRMIRPPRGWPAFRPLSFAATPAGAAPLELRVEPEEDDSAWAAVTILLAVFGCGMAAIVCFSGPSPWVAMFAVLVALGALGLVNPRSCIFLTLAYLAVQGDVRRIVSLGMPAGRDPLVLVGPAIALLLTGIAIVQNRLTRSTPLSRQICIVLAIMAVQAFNPAQGGLMVGMTGVLCIIIPMCWFWVGQSWGSQRFMDQFLFGGIVPVAAAAAAFGLVQVFVGRPDYQDQWMKVWSQAYLSHNGLDLANINPDWQRPFGFFTSVSEFTKFLAVAIVLLLSSLIGGRFRILLLSMPVLMLALFLASARGPIVLICAVTTILWSMYSRSRSEWFLRLFLAGACVVGALVWTLTKVHNMEVSSPTLEYLVKHQTEGLLNPLDERKSTVSGHVLLPIQGLADSLRRPLGLGLGAATHVAGSYGAAYAGTEVDISNMFVCLGVVGGVAYVLLYFRVFTTAVKYWRATRSRMALALIAVFLVLVGNWLNTGEYSTLSLLWFCAGSLDRLSARAKSVALSGS